MRPRVVIIGCGFGGIEAVRTLSGAPVDITLIDRTNHHLFQPLLYQVATAGLAAPSISGPIRHILRREMQRGNLTVLLGEVSDIDVAARCVVLDGRERLPYDHLIVAAGATHSYFGHDAWAPYAPGLKTLADAFEIRRRVLLAFEHAERQASAEARAPWLTFAVVGAGPTGVEMAGTMAEIARHTLRGEYHRIDTRSARVVLIEGAPRVLTAFPEKLSQRAREQLEQLGVEVLADARVSEISADGIHYLTTPRPADTPGTPPRGDGPGLGRPGAAARDETRGADGTTQSNWLPCRTVVWAAGVAASLLGRSIAAGTGCTLDRAGRVVVEPDLSVPGHPEIQVVGDLAAALSHNKRGQPTPVPGVSPGAKQMGRMAAANLLRRLRGEPTLAFRYIDYGSLATIGRKSAVAMVDVPLLGSVRFSGYAAWLFWLFVHIYFLIGFRNRFVVLLDWAWAYFSFERQARVVAGAEPAIAAAKAPDGPSP